MDIAVNRQLDLGTILEDRLEVGSVEKSSVVLEMNCDVPGIGSSQSSSRASNRHLGCGGVED